MQISRLFEIVYLLLSRRQVTASQLAERLEVSTRTIHRDVETLAQAGIPVYTERGHGGGIRLEERFVLSRSVLTDTEQREILAALQGLSVAKGGGIEVLGRLSALWGRDEEPWIDVDFSDWSYNGQQSVERIKEAILGRRLLRFEYFGSSGEPAVRTVEPSQLWFKHSRWYLKAFCTERQAARLFKLTRMKRLEVLEETFERRREVPTAEPPEPVRPLRAVTVTIRMDASQLYRIYDEFDENAVTQNPDGSFLATATFPEDEWVYGYLLSFGANAEVVGPPHIRAIIRERLAKNLALYETNKTD